MTAPPPDEVGDDLREALRDLLPDYQPPADPFVRVGAAVRRRRRLARARLAAVGEAAAAAAAVAFVPTLIPTPAGTAPAAAPSIPFVAATGVEPVASGTVGGLRWAFGSTAPSARETRCLYGDGGALDRTLGCFSSWEPAQRAAWTELPVRGGTAGSATAVLGVVPTSSLRATVVLRDGGQVGVRAVLTATDREARFFAVVLPGTRVVREVRLSDGGGPDTDPGPQVDCGSAVCSVPAN